MYTPRILLKRRFTASDIHVQILTGKEWQSNSVYDDAVNEVWKQKEATVAKNGEKIWDGTYYRVENVKEVEQGQEKIVLTLGTVSYRYIATYTVLQELFSQNALEPTCHLATAAMIRTKEGLYLFGKRSQGGGVDLIGGGVQSDEIEVVHGSDLEKNLRKEMSEEAGILEHHIQKIEGVGIVYSYTSNVIIISFVHLNLSRKEVEEAFKTRGDNEMSELVFVSEDELESFLKRMTSYRPLIVDLLRVNKGALDQ